MKNDYEVRGNITAIFLKRKDGTVLETVIDTADLDRANEFPHSWYASLDKGTKTYYVLGHITSNNGKKTNVGLHRWIMNETVLKVDHINHDTLNNRRSVNLRQATHQQNKQNRSGAQANSKSGIRGVVWSENKGKWEAYITVNKKCRYLGCYGGIEEAERVVKEARAKHMPYSQEALSS